MALPMPMPMPSPSHTPAMPARHSDVRPRDVSSRLLGGWAAGLAGMRELRVALAAAEAGGLRPEAGKLASSSTSSGYAGRKISSPPLPLLPDLGPHWASGPPWGRHCREVGKGVKGSPACLLVLVCFHLPRFPSPNASILPCVHAVTCQLLSPSPP